MRRKLKWGLGILGVLVLGLLAVPFFIPESWWQEQLETGLEAALAREVTVGGMEVSLLGSPSVTLKDLEIADAPGFEGGAFLTASEAEVKIAFLPLLARRVSVRSIRIEDWTVRVRRDAEGNTNLPTAARRGSPGGAVGLAAVSAGGSDWRFAARVRVSGGEVVLEDAMTGIEGTVRGIACDLDVDDFGIPDAAAGAWGYLRAGAFDGELRVEAIRFPDLDLADLVVRVDGDGSRVRMPDLSMQCNGGTVRGNAEVVPPGDRPVYRAGLEVRGVRISEGLQKRLLNPLMQLRHLPLQGTVDATIEGLVAEGTTETEILSTLYGTGRVSVGEAVVRDHPLYGRFIGETWPSLLRPMLQEKADPEYLGRIDRCFAALGGGVALGIGFTAEEDRIESVVRFVPGPYALSARGTFFKSDQTVRYTFSESDVEILAGEGEAGRADAETFRDFWEVSLGGEEQVLLEGRYGDRDGIEPDIKGLIAAMAENWAAREIRRRIEEEIEERVGEELRDRAGEEAEELLDRLLRGRNRD